MKLTLQELTLIQKWSCYVTRDWDPQDIALRAKIREERKHLMAEEFFGVQSSGHITPPSDPTTKIPHTKTASRRE